MRRKASAVLAAVALVLTLGGAATAGDFTLVPSTIPGCGACTSPVANVFGFTWVGTTFSRTELGADGVLSVGDSFTDHGALLSTGLTSAPSTPILPGLTGVNVNWQLGAIFSLPGTITGVDTTNGGHSAALPLLNFVFTPGSTISLYANPGLTLNNNAPATIGGTTLVATLTVLSGGGNLDFLTLDGNIDVETQFTSLPVPGFFEFLGVPVDLNTHLFFAFTDSNNNVLASAPPVATTTATNFSNFFGLGVVPSTSSLDQTWLSNDGSAEFAITAVPNPSALMMVGTALLGLGSLAAYRRRG